jgi:hypothetical protein
MNRKQGPRFAGMRPAAIVAGRRQRVCEPSTLVKEAEA